MKQGILITSLWVLYTALLICCGDQKTPLPTIEGKWTAIVPNHPNWLYEFDNGLFTHYRTDLITGEVEFEQYAYTVLGDTLYFGGNGSTPPRQWLLEFKCECIVHTTPLNVPIAHVLYLERVQQ